jgi:hypothetical protein
MQRQGVSKETRKANIRLAIILGIVVILGVISTFFTLGDKI